MKRIFASTILLLALFAVAFISPPDSKPTQPVGVIVPIINDTCSNSMNKTGYLHFEQDKIVDSVQFIMYAKGEIDVDRFIATKGFEFETSPGTHISKNYTTAAGDTTTLTTDNAATVATVELITSWAGSKIRGANMIYCQIDAGASGNDATDPNALKLFGKVFYRPE